MKKLICASLLLLSAAAANAQKRYINWGNSTTYDIDAIYYGDNAGTCSPIYQTTTYSTTPAGSLDAFTASWTTTPTPPVNVFNKVTLVYKVSGIPVSSYDINFCTASTGYTTFTFPSGGPTMRYHFLANPSNYELILDY